MGLDNGYGLGIGSLKPGVCTSSTRPTSPFDGQVIYMTDVDQTAVWDGIQWTVLAPIAGGRNRIINGGFDIWQRGTTGFGTGVYNADRWYGAVNAGAGSFAQSTATPLVSGSRFFVRGTASVASTNLFVYTALERADVVRLRSKVVVLSAYVRGTYTGNISISATYSTSTDALVSQSTAVASLNTTAVTTSFQRVSVSFTVPSDAVGLRLGVGTTATPMANTQTIDIWGVQLEEGAVATPFEFGDFGTTLQKCQRYFEKSYNVDTAPGTAGTLGQSIGLGIHTNTPATYSRFGSGISFKVPKRTTPTVVQYAPASGSSAAASNTTHGDGDTAVGYVSAQQINQNGFNLAASFGGTTTTGYFTIFVAYTASAEL
jgi:hypothetical protein